MRSLLAILSLSLAGACNPAPLREARPTEPPPSAPAGVPSSMSDPQDPVPDPLPTADPRPASAPRTELATFGAGCFWCVEAVLEQLDGVLDVTSGYMGGHVPNPTYKAVCTGETGHAEVVQVTFDPARISYDALLEWFWRLHDPTTLDRQGADVGTQYRSVIFVHSPEQRRLAEASKLAAAPSFDDPIVTEITDAGTFWSGEGYHQDYYRQNRSQGYCRMVIAPKLKKLELKD